MSTLSPALADALALLSDNLYGHLDEAESVADPLTEGFDDMETAHQLIRDLVEVIRSMLIEHQLADGGECQFCTSAWPCQVVETIHASVKDPKRQFVPLFLRARNLD